MKKYQIKDAERRDFMKGLYGKYIITKASGKPLNDDFYAIVLRIDGGRYLKACRAGVKAFADAVREENQLLAEDLDKKLLELAVEDILMKTKHARIIPLDVFDDLYFLKKALKGEK